MKFKSRLTTVTIIAGLIGLAWTLLGFQGDAFYETRGEIFAAMGIVTACFILYLLWLIIFGKQGSPWQEIKVKNVFEEVELVLNSAFKLSEDVEVGISGRLSGRAEIYLYNEDHEMEDSFTLHGSFEIKIKHPCTSKKCFIKYHPVSVKSGVLNVKYRFWGFGKI